MRRRFSVDVQQEIEPLHEQGYGPKQILDKLVSRFGRAEVPSLRTVQSIVSELKRRDDTSETWTVAEASPAEISLVMPVLHAVAEETSSRTVTMTRDRAEWVLKVRAAAPQLPLWSVYRFAQRYGAGGDKPVELDALLALAPWRSRRARRQFFDAVAAGDLDRGLVGTAWFLLGPYVLPPPVVTRAEAQQLEDQQLEDHQLRDLWLFAYEAQDVIDLFIKEIYASVVGRRKPRQNRTRNAR